MPDDKPKENSPAEKPVSLTLSKFLYNAWSEADRDPKFSMKEKSDLKKMKKALDEKHDLDKETITRKTQKELDELIDDTKSRIVLRTLDRKLTKTDIEDISEYLELILDSRPISVPGTRTDIADKQDAPESVTRRSSAKSEFDKIAKEKKIDGVESVADLRELPVELLMKLEDEHEGILLYAFTDFADDSKKIDLANFESFYKNPTPGTRFKVNFRGNPDAEKHLGAADLCPPSIRRITILQEGNDDLARTSTKRLGLKGQNKRGNGFFDADGYIPVYTSDEIIVGGIQKDQKEKTDTGIDLNFEKKYRDPAGKLDYKKYQADHGEEEAKLVKTMEAHGIRVAKVYTPEELQTLESKIEATGVRKNIVQAAMELLKNGTKGRFCWDWVDKVYDQAGAKRGTVAYKHSKYNNSNFDKNNPGKCENPPQVKTIQPGDWIFIYNKNGIDKYDDHSVLFLDWEDKTNLIAKVANCTGSGKPGTLRTVDFKKTPLTMLIKPKA